MPDVWMCADFCRVLSATIGQEISMRQLRLALKRPDGITRPHRVSGYQYVLTTQDLENAIAYFERRQQKRAERQAARQKVVAQ